MIHEGVDIDAATFLRYAIFAKGHGCGWDALMAPIQTGDMPHVCNGASRMQKVLLEAELVLPPGKKKYCCQVLRLGFTPLYLVCPSFF